jgi:ribonuclease HII
VAKTLRIQKVPSPKTKKKHWLCPDHDRDLADAFSFSEPDYVIGLDEVGRGCLAGPVFSGAFCYHFQSRTIVHADFVKTKVCDSKILKPEERALAEKLLLAVGRPFRGVIGEASVDEIDLINIHHASLLAMTRAFDRVLEFVADREVAQPKILVLVDGSFVPKEILRCTEEEGGRALVRSVVKGDSLSFAIAAASIIAKEARDRFMRKMAEIYPGYKWEQNVGYATPEHRAAVQKLGRTSWHRKTFNCGEGPVDEMTDELLDESTEELLSEAL